MEAPIRVEIDDGIAVVTFDEPGQAVNTMSDQVRNALGVVAERLERDRELFRGVILRSAKSTFFAGGNLVRLFNMTPADAPRLFTENEAGKRALRKVERLGKPVVAALNGTALGGGFEIALACHHRIALRNAKAQFGLPEVTLGLMPGLGGVARLNRMLGLVRSQPFLAEGSLMSVEQAHENGLIDEVVDSPEAMMQSARRWIDAHPDAAQPWDLPGYKPPGGLPDGTEVKKWLGSGAVAAVRAKTAGCYPAAEAILSASLEGLQVDFEASCRIETRHFVNITTSPVAKNIMKATWFHAREAKALALAHVEAADGPLAKVLTIVGARVEAATQLAEAARQRGFQVSYLEDGAATDSGDDARGTAVKFLAQSLAATGRSGSALMLAATSRQVEGTDTNDHVRWHVPAHQPAAKMVEIITSGSSSDATVSRAVALADQLGMLPIVTRNDSLVARMVSAYVSEGAALLEEGVDPAVLVSAVWSAGFPAGPVELGATCRRPSNTPSRLARKIPMEDIRDRLLFSVATEGLRCLQEGLVSKACEVNCASILGALYPRWTGGAIQFFNWYGVARSLDRLSGLATRFGTRFAAPPTLVRALETKAL